VAVLLLSFALVGANHVLPARAAESAAAYDRDGVAHNIECIATRNGGPVPVRNVEGEPLSVLQGGARLQLSDPPLHLLAAPRARPCIRIQAIEAIDSRGMKLFYTWPFEPSEVATGAPQQYPGLVWGGELAAEPELDSPDGERYGLPAPAAPGEPAYAVTPADIDIPEQMYRGPSTGAFYSFSPYGKDVGGAQFALLSWTWVDAAGGGIGRAAVSEGERFYPANVKPIVLASVASDHSSDNGSVTARYGYVRHGAQRTYGWMAMSHVVLVNGEARCIDQMEYAGGGPALADALCPPGESGANERTPWTVSLGGSSEITYLLAEGQPAH
jgi:hypothetical protein